MGDPPSSAERAGLEPRPSVIVQHSQAFIIGDNNIQNNHFHGPPARDVVKDAKKRLTYLVGNHWSTETASWGLDNPRPIPVQWDLTREQVMDEGAEPAAASLRLPASSREIGRLADGFRRMDQRRLVVLGKPGSGKTTLAAQLLLKLLPGAGEGEPVPVLLSVTSWDAERTSLKDWLSDQLKQDYPALCAPEFGPDVIKALTGDRHILPVLDGLDELSPSGRAAVITALNEPLARREPLILTSRTAEYVEATAAAGKVLASAVVIESRPLDAATAARCLRERPHHRDDQSWQPVLNRLDALGEKDAADDPLASNLTTAFGLWLLRAVYIDPPRPDKAPSLLLDRTKLPDAKSLRDHLLDQVIPALISTRTPSKDHAVVFHPRRRRDPRKTRAWLGFLAYHLASQPGGEGVTRDIAWWRLAGSTRFITPVRQGTVALALGLVLGLLAGFTAGFLALPQFGLGVEIGLPIIGGAIGALTFGLSAGRWSREPPGFADLSLRRRITALAGVFVFRLIAGLPFGVGGAMAAQGTSVDARLTMGLAFWAVGVLVGPYLGGRGGTGGGLLQGLTVWAETPAQTEKVNAPLAGWRADRRLNLFRAAAGALAWGIALGVINTAISKSTGHFTSGFALGLASGLIISFGSGQHRAWVAYTITCWRLWWAGLLPLRLMPFLDDAHRLGLLRAAGPVYQFRHAELHDYLSDTYRSTE